MINKITKSEFILLVVTVLSTIIFVLMGRNISTIHNIEVGGFSRETFKANSDVQSDIATENMKEEARKTVPDLYKIDEDVNAEVINGIDEFFTVADSERQNYKTYLEGNPEVDEFKSSKIEMFLGDKSEDLLKMSNNDYEYLKSSTYTIVNSALKKGIRESNEQSNLDEMRNSFDALNMPEASKDIGKSLVAIFFKPNLVYDEESTLKARHEKAEAVQPVVYKKGQKIVAEGELITEPIYEVLQKQGYVSKASNLQYYSIIGLIGLVLILFTVLLTYLYYNKDDLFSEDKSLIFLVTIYEVTLLFIWITKDMENFINPILWSVLLVSVFFKINFALLYGGLISIIGMLIVNGNQTYLLFTIIMSMIIAIIARFVLVRKRIAVVAIFTSLFAGVLTVFLNFVMGEVDLSTIMFSSIYSMGSAGGMIILATGSIPLWEAIFDIVTPVKLLELSNPSNELIKRLIIEAPGTYHHSLVVSNLAEAAAIDIGANGFLARVGGYYHDIGKLSNPAYFTENQVGENLHDKLTTKESVDIIRNHVTYGMVLAEEYKLPKVVARMIPEHHGNSLIIYFYVKAINEAAEGEVMDENDYRYHNNIPQSKESAILMLADSVEAGVRSMVTNDKSSDEIHNFIEMLFKERLDDGQLNDSGLTIGDLQVIKQSFINVFKGMYHHRVEYPTLTARETAKMEDDTEVKNDKDDLI